MRQDVIHIVRLSAYSEYRDFSPTEVLLKLNVLIQGDENIKSSLCEQEQLAILFPRPSNFLDSQAFIGMGC